MYAKRDLCREIIVSGQFCKQNTNIDKWSLHIQTRLVKVKIRVPIQHFIYMFGETICISFKLHLLRTRMCSARSKMVIIICKECKSGIQKWQLFMWPCYIHSFNIDTCFEKNMEYEKNLDIQWIWKLSVYIYIQSPKLRKHQTHANKSIFTEHHVLQPHRK